jgi:hypothetical protein
LIALVPDAWVNVYVADPPPASRRLAAWSLCAGLSGILAAVSWRRVSPTFAVSHLVGFALGVLCGEWAYWSLIDALSSGESPPFSPDPGLYIAMPTSFALAVGGLALRDRLSSSAALGPGRAEQNSMTGIVTVALVLVALVTVPSLWWFASPLLGANQVYGEIIEGRLTIGTREEPASFWSGEVRCLLPDDEFDVMTIDGIDVPLPGSHDRIVGIRAESYVELRTSGLQPYLTSIGTYRDFEGVVPGGRSGSVVLRDTRPDTLISWECGLGVAGEDGPTSSPAANAGSTEQHLDIRRQGIEVNPPSVTAGDLDITAATDLEGVFAGTFCSQRPPPCRAEATIDLMLLGPLTEDHVELLEEGDVSWRGEFFRRYAIEEPGVVAELWTLQPTGTQPIGGITLTAGVYAWILLDPYAFTTFAVD